MNEKRTMTHWTEPTELIDSEYGRITYREWCEKESERINRRGDNVGVVTRENDGFVALSR